MKRRQLCNCALKCRCLLLIRTWASQNPKFLFLHLHFILVFCRLFLDFIFLIIRGCYRWYTVYITYDYTILATSCQSSWLIMFKAALIHMFILTMKKNRELSAISVVPLVSTDLYGVFLLIVLVLQPPISLFWFHCSQQLNLSNSNPLYTDCLASHRDGMS